jgi:hypothetical protein
MSPYRVPSFDARALPARFAAELMAELEPGERVLWAALPRRVALARRAVGELVMPVAFNGFVLGLMALCSQEGASLALCAVPLLALGLPLFQAPLGAWHAMQTTFYAVTDRRALVFDADAILSVERRDIVAVRVRERAAGTGDIAVVVRPPRRVGAELLGVPAASEVAELLRG